MLLSIFFHQTSTKYRVDSHLDDLLKRIAGAEDVLQETYLKIWVHADRYHAKGTPMAWILMITKNLSLMKLREKKKHQELEPEEWDINFHIPDSELNKEKEVLEVNALNADAEIIL